MRTLEIILLVVVTVLPFVKRKILLQFRSNYILVFLLLLLALHLLIDGARWQMFPVYFLLLLVGWRIKAVDISQPARLNFLRVSGYILFSIFAILAWVLPMVLPVFDLPEPRGKYEVGTELIHVKTDRPEKITEDESDKREFLCKIWYPSNAETDDLEGESYIDPSSRAGFATKYGLPANALNFLDHVKTFVYPDLPVAEGTFPVLLFSHGYGSKATGYYALLTELTSQGYIIINMNHTYESLGASFPDGRQKFFDYGYQQKISEWNAELLDPMRKAFKDGISYEKRHQIAAPAIRNYFEKDIQGRWAKDMESVLNLLEEWNSKGPFANKLDLNKIGALGHSVGGGSVGRLAIQDERIKAAANLDGIQWGEMIDTTYQIPYLYISADWPADHEDMNSHVYINKSTDYFYETKLLNSGHPNFMDIPFMIPVKALAGTGDIDPYLGIEIVTKLVDSFFEQHLLNEEKVNTQNIAKQYEALEMKVHNGDSTHVREGSF
ncbi:hypothetical protein QYS49_38580 [Marivirga salinae]|uniref:Carboxylic ester hydrolase n=1 Tax=Marivirga salinarum TaxID=3059078 RepID=A0AA51NDA5_9BACT|nr:hypothetical protein [Marivirga sp. BDSF4-3]WMN11500.1 hypothetical protein QYS49_38580 [Marivirga sp. BDSF4-3]